MQLLDDAVAAPTFVVAGDNETLAFVADFGAAADAALTLVFTTTVPGATFSLLREAGDSPIPIAVNANELYAVLVPPFTHGFAVSEQFYAYIAGWSNA